MHCPLIVFFLHSRVHISESTYNCVKLDYEVEPGEGHTRNDFIKEKGIKTYLIVRRINHGDDNKISGGESQVCARAHCPEKMYLIQLNDLNLQSIYRIIFKLVVFTNLLAKFIMIWRSML